MRGFLEESYLSTLKVETFANLRIFAKVYTRENVLF